MRKIKRQGVAIDKLAQKLSSNKPKTATYATGNPDEKVWINFQSTKKQKREFTQVCNDNQINASAFLRTCVALLIKNEGSVRDTLNKLKPKDDSTLQSKEEPEESIDGQK